MKTALTVIASVLTPIITHPFHRWSATIRGKSIAWPIFTIIGTASGIKWHLKHEAFYILKWFDNNNNNTKYEVCSIWKFESGDSNTFFLNISAWTEKVKMFQRFTYPANRLCLDGHLFGLIDNCHRQSFVLHGIYHAACDRIHHQILPFSVIIGNQHEHTKIQRLLVDLKQNCKRKQLFHLIG